MKLGFGVIDTPPVTGIYSAHMWVLKTKYSNYRLAPDIPFYQLIYYVSSLSIVST